MLDQPGGQFIVMEEPSVEKKVVSTLEAQSQTLVNGVGTVNYHRLLLLEGLATS